LAASGIAGTTKVLDGWLKAVARSKVRGSDIQMTSLPNPTTGKEHAMQTEHAKPGPDGRIVIPANLRHELGFKPGDALVLESDCDSLLVRSFDAVIRETQEYIRQFPAGGSEVDALIAERRAEAAVELAAEREADARARGE